MATRLEGISALCKFPNIIAQDIDFTNSYIEGYFIGAGKHILKHLDFTNANLTGANFTGATLRGIDFSNANLRMADFRNAHLDQNKFHKADLTGANFDGSKVDTSDFLNSNLTLARLVNLKGGTMSPHEGLHSKYTTIISCFRSFSRGGCICK